MNVFAFGQKIFQQLHRYYLIDICGVRCVVREGEILTFFVKCLTKSLTKDR